MDRRLLRLGLSVAAIVLVFALRQLGIELPGAEAGAVDPRTRTEVSARSVDALEADLARIERAVSSHESGFMVEVAARVVKRLPDDREGSRHQRFLIELETGRTLLVAHNIDLAPRAEIREGDRVRVRGQYEWNDRGGVLHWTHHDPAGRHPGGWIEAAGRRVE